MLEKPGFLGKNVSIAECSARVRCGKQQRTVNKRLLEPAPVHFQEFLAALQPQCVPVDRKQRA